MDKQIKKKRWTVKKVATYGGIALFVIFIGYQFIFAAFNKSSLSSTIRIFPLFWSIKMSVKGRFKFIYKDCPLMGKVYTERHHPAKQGRNAV